MVRVLTVRVVGRADTHCARHLHSGPELHFLEPAQGQGRVKGLYTSHYPAFGTSLRDKAELEQGRASAACGSTKAFVQSSFDTTIDVLWHSFIS